MRRGTVIDTAYASTTRASVQILMALREQIAELSGQVQQCFGQHPDTEIVLSQPGMGTVLGARVLAEFARRSRPLRHRQGPQKLRRHQPSHPGLGQEEDHHGPVRPQRPAPRRPHQPGIQRPDQLSRRTRLLRPPPRSRRRPPRRPAPARQPPRRHPPRLSQDPHPLRRGHRLALPLHRPDRRLTFNAQGCLYARRQALSGQAGKPAPPMRRPPPSRANASTHISTSPQMWVGCILHVPGTCSFKCVTCVKCVRCVSIWNREGRPLLEQ